MACGWLGGCREGNYLLGESPLHSEAEYSPSTGTEASHCSQWSHGSSTAILIRVGAQLVSSNLDFVSPLVRSIRSFVLFAILDVYRRVLASLWNLRRFDERTSIVIVSSVKFEDWFCYWHLFCFRTNSLVFRYDFTMTTFKQVLSWKLSLAKYRYETIPSLPVVSRDLVRDSHTHDLDWRLHRKSCNLCVTV